MIPGMIFCIGMVLYIFVPGAAICTVPVPQLENEARLSFWSLAATAMILLSHDIVASPTIMVSLPNPEGKFLNPGIFSRLLPSFPAAAMNNPGKLRIALYVRKSKSALVLISSIHPKLALITRAPLCFAKLIPRMIVAVLHPHLSLRIFTAIRVTFGLTPAIHVVLFVMAPIVPAT